MASEPRPVSRGIRAAFSVAAGVVYYLSNPSPQSFYDYTFRVAENLLRGRAAFTEPQPPWLNEFVPFEGFYYSVFPLGSVLSMVPAALLKIAGVITAMPSALIAAIFAAVSFWLLAAIGSRYAITRTRVLVMSAGVLFGTFAWTNVTMGGAWQLALAFAMAGELGAIWFTVFDRRPLIAGAFFALAFGNRTEILLTAPVFFWLLSRDGVTRRRGDAAKEKLPASALRRVAEFSAVPFVLGVATLVYNYVRFHSFTDFGYARIPGVLDEPWYSHGIFSWRYIPGQMWEMLWKPWLRIEDFPYIVPEGFSSSIILSSPFLLYLVRFGGRDRVLKYAAWAAIIVLTLLLWTHGNAGGWQFGYRYAMVLLPWAYVIMLESAPAKLSPLEWTAYIASIAINLYATWLFHWTEYVKPWALVVFAWRDP
jgi:hypothetical protein